MKRFGRWLFYMAAGISLLLCIASAIAFVASYEYVYSLSRSGEFREYTGGWGTYLQLRQGRLTIYVAVAAVAKKMQPYPPPPTVTESILFRNRWKLPFAWRLWSYSWARRPAPPGFGPAGYWDAGVNLLLVAAVFAILPAIVRIRYLRNRYFKRRPGFCRKCRYDLRATPDRCPECGAIPADRERISVS